MKKTILILLFTLFASSLYSQRFITQNGYVRFFSEAPLEDIEAVNNSVACIVDIKTGEIVSKVNLKDFQFEKALMQEHFNENYVESHKYPHAILKAKIVAFQEVDFDSETFQAVTLKGTMDFHNVVQEVSIEGAFKRTSEGYEAKAKFIMKPADYEIKIPRIVRNNIAKEVEVTLSFNLSPLK